MRISEIQQIVNEGMENNETFKARVKECVNGSLAGFKLVIEFGSDGKPRRFSLGSQKSPMPFISGAEAMRMAVPIEQRPEPPELEDVKAARLEFEEADKARAEANDFWISSIRRLDKITANAKLENENDPRYRKYQEAKEEVEAAFGALEEAGQEAGALQRKYWEIRDRRRVEKLFEAARQRQAEEMAQKRAKLEEQGRKRATLIERAKAKIMASISADANE